MDKPQASTGVRAMQFFWGNWGERRGLNPRPSVPQTDALPAELRSPPSDSSSLHYLQGAATASVFRRIFVPNREFRLCVQIGLFARMRKRFLGAGTSKFRGIWRLHLHLQLIGVARALLFRSRGERS